MRLLDSTRCLTLSAKKMSGIEIFGIGASVLQIADLGTRVSVKLFGFARKIRGAAEKIDLISKEIAATGALLQQLSEQLDKDSKTQLLRRELVDSANELVQECNKIFKNIDKAIDGTSGNKIILSLKQKVHYAYLESEIEALRMNLENLKSSICIMQNILIYAEQLRNRERLPVLKEQQDLLKALNEEKLANEQRYNKLMRAIKQSPDSPPATSFHAGFASAQFSAVHVPVGSSSEQFAAKNIQCTQSPSPQQPHMHNIDQREWHDYNTLMSQILKEVHSNNYNLKSEIRRRLQDGVLEVHWQEWATFRKSLGDDALLGMLYNLPELRKFWLMKIEKQRATHFMLQNVSSDKPVVERPRDHIDISHRFDPDTEKARTRFELLKQQEGVKKLREAHELQLKRKEEEGVLSRKGGASACFRVRQQQRVEGHGYVDERPRLTYTRVEKKHLSEDTLNFYQLPWEMDQVCHGDPLPLFSSISPSLLQRIYKMS